MTEENKMSELSEDMEVVGPGSMLGEARKTLGLSAKQVAEKLNFRTALVMDIENETFDKSLPETFNRGYLRNYAKLVNVNETDVITSYEMLHVAEKQGAEMLSFSKGTEKKAENTRIMWTTYLILGGLIASTIVWWLQSSNTNKSIEVPVVKHASTSSSVAQTLNTTKNIKQNALPAVESTPETQQLEISNNESSVSLPVIAEPEVIRENTSVEVVDKPLVSTIEESTSSVVNTPIDQVKTIENSEPQLVHNEAGKVLITTPPVDTIFNFSGDCWVNIYDANGEHIAWGIKKSGYEMKISAIAPLSITLGKPELVTINFDGESIDTSTFARGNIAKFTLPFAELE